MTKHVSLQAGERPTWRLRKAVLIYLPENVSPFGARDGVGAYATLHPVIADQPDVRLGAGVPATREACADIARALGAAAQLGGFVPPNLLYLGARSIIWWRPPGRARVFFDTTGTVAGDQYGDPKGAQLLGKTNGMAAHPGLVFAVAGRQWYVYALPDDVRPHAGTTLWRAPYFNVYADGQICTGNVRLPESLSAATLRQFEKAFFDSEFTHPNVRGKEKLLHYAHGPYDFWAGLLKRPDDLGFPVNNLVKMNLTLERLAKKLENGGREEVDE